MKKLCVLLIVVLLTLSCVPAFAGWGGDRHDNGRYVYRNHRYYREGAWWDFGITALAVGAILASRPDNGRYVAINGQTYYYCDGNYYQQVPQGYVIVQPPVVVTAPATNYYVAPAAPVVIQAPAGEGQPVEVNVPNSDGTFTKVTLFRHQNGFKGPQGEFYPGNPTVDQLRTLYGR
jgi:hypothetical protein